MKGLLIVLAAVGTLAVLSIGGCVAIAMFAVAAAPDVPEYVSEDYFRSHYKADLQEVHRYLNKGSNQKLKLHDDVVAILQVNEGEFISDTSYTDIYKRFFCRKRRFSFAY